MLGELVLEGQWKITAIHVLEDKRIEVDNLMSLHAKDKGIIHTTSYSQGHPNYTTINSNRTAELEGFPAYSLEFSDINTDDNSTYKDLE